MGAGSRGKYPKCRTITKEGILKELLAGAREYIFKSVDTISEMGEGQRSGHRGEEQIRKTYLKVTGGLAPKEIIIRQGFHPHPGPDVPPAVCLEIWLTNADGYEDAEMVMRQTKVPAPIQDLNRRPGGDEGVPPKIWPTNDGGNGDGNGGGRVYGHLANVRAYMTAGLDEDKEGECRNTNGRLSTNTNNGKDPGAPIAEEKINDEVGVDDLM